MPRRYWLSLIAAIALLAGGANAHPIGHDASGKTSTGYSQAKPELDPSQSLQAAIQNDIHSIAGTLKAANEKKLSATEDRRAQRNLQSQEDMAYWAKRMFLVGIAEILITAAGVFLVWRTLVASRDSARQAKRAADAARDTVNSMEDTAKRQLRAYVGIESIYLASPNIDVNEFDVPQPPYQSGFTFSDTVRIKVRNFGQTPASEVAAFVAYHTFIPFGSAPARGDRLDSPFSPDLIANACRPIVDSDSAFTFTVPIKKSLEPFRKAMRKEVTLLFDGHVEYTDVFGTAWNRKFRFVWQPWCVEEDRLLPTKEGNVETRAIECA